MLLGDYKGTSIRLLQPRDWLFPLAVKETYMESPFIHYQETIAELEVEIAFMQLELTQYRTLAEKHNCSTPKELDSYIEQLVFYSS